MNALARLAAGALAAGLLLGCAAGSRASARFPGESDATPPPSFEVDGTPLCFVGANNYYVSYKPRPMVDDLLFSARDLGVKVLRVWGFIDRGSLDGQVKNIDGSGSKDGVYFQAWDPATHHAIYNDGDNGLARLDYALARAGQLGLKLVIVLTNNWHDFGGMDQYLAWYGLDKHAEFYINPTVAQAYEDWALHLVTHVNSITHVSYRDDPTIFAWELGNEPRNEGVPSAELTAWAGEMSAYVKSIDPNHLVAVGDEGFLAPGSQDCFPSHKGVDHRALTALSTVDYGTFHLYPQTWGTGYTRADRWIEKHIGIARELDKPTVLEEYGVSVERDTRGQIKEGLDRRLSAYRRWNESLFAEGGSGAMFWLLAGTAENGDHYPDYDHFTVYRGDESAALLGDFARHAHEAAACRGTASVAGAPSPFVRVSRRPRATALGWRTNDD